MTGQQDIAVEFQDLATILSGEGRPVVVEFWAPWCGTCRLLADSIRKLATEPEVSVRVTTIDMEKSPQAAEAYAVRTLPTILVFVGGLERRRITGLLSYSALKAEIGALAPQ